MTSPTVRTPSRGTEITSPAATRTTVRPSWRDPRLLVGVLLVCGSVVLGARLLTAADDTVPVLVAAGPLAAGERLDADDLVTAQVRFAEADDADRYLPGDAEVDDVVLLRPVGAGELVPRAALGSAGDSGQVAVPLPVDASRVPAGVHAGSVVDVWAGPADRAASQAAGGPGTGAGGRAAGSEQLLADAPVLSVERPDGLGPGTVVQVVVGVPDARADAVAEVVAGLADRALLVVSRDR